MAITSLLKTGGFQPDMDVQLLAAADVDTNGSGDIAITFPNLKEVFWAHLEIAGGHIAHYHSKVGNIVTFRVYVTGTGDGAALTAKATGLNLGAGVATAFGKV